MRRLALLLPLAACMPADPAAERRAAYLDCARAQGVAVEAGRIVTRSPADLGALDACAAPPR